MTKLFEILNGICDQKEYRDQNLASLKSIICYAEASGQDISEDDARRIQKVGLKWLHEQEHGNGEWSRMRHEAMAALD